MTFAPNHSGPEGGSLPTDTSAYRAVVEEYDDASDECTIYPMDASLDERVTLWISAQRPGFVDLEDVR
jgi:hypothetical protein